MCANLLKCCCISVTYFGTLQNAELSVTFFVFVQRLQGLKKPDNLKEVNDLFLRKSGNRTGPFSEVKLCLVLPCIPVQGFSICSGN